MQIGEAKISALAVSALTGVGLTLALNSALHNLEMALTFAVPAALVMGVVLFLFANDDIKKGGEKPPQKQTTKGE